MMFVIYEHTKPESSWTCKNDSQQCLFTRALITRREKSVFILNKVLYFLYMLKHRLSWVQHQVCRLPSIALISKFHAFKKNQTSRDLPPFIKHRRGVVAIRSNPVQSGKNVADLMTSNLTKQEQSFKSDVIFYLRYHQVPRSHTGLEQHDRN